MTAPARVSFIDKIIVGDILKTIRHIPTGAVDLVITSPPYNLKNSTGNGMKDGRGGKWANAALVNGYADHDDCMEHSAYVKWQRACLSEMLRVIPDHGAIFCNHKWRVQGGLLQDRADILQGFPLSQLSTLPGERPAGRGGGRPDVSRADFTWCLIALDWGYSVEETAARLMQESSKAQENGRAYALRTARNAAAAIERRQGQQR